MYISNKDKQSNLIHLCTFSSVLLNFAMNLFNLIEICVFVSCLYLYFSFGIFVNFYDFFLFTIEVTVLSKLSCVQNKRLVLRILVFFFLYLQDLQYALTYLKQKNRKSIRFMSFLFFEHAASKPKHKVTIKTTRSTSCGFSVFSDCFDQSQVSLLQFLLYILIMKNTGTPPFRYVRNYFKRFWQVLWLFD